MDWIDAYVIEEGDVVIEAYAKTCCWFGVVVPVEEITAAVIGNDDIAIDGDSGELILGVGADEQRVDLAERLWRRLPPGR